jgi:hypothetical protein
MRRNKSLPPEHMEKLPEISAKKDKESLLNIASKIYESGS